MSFLQKKSGDGAKRFYYRRFGQSQSEGALPYREKRSDREQRLFRNLRLASYPACVLFASHLALSVARSFLFFFFIPFFLFRAPHAPAKSARFVPGVASREGLYKSIKDARKKLDLNPKSLCLVSINCSGNRPVFIRLLTRGLRQKAAADCVVRLCDTSSTSGSPFAFSSLFSSSISTYCQWPSFTVGRK